MAINRPLFNYGNSIYFTCIGVYCNSEFKFTSKSTTIYRSKSSTYYERSSNNLHNYSIFPQPQEPHIFYSTGNFNDIFITNEYHWNVNLSNACEDPWEYYHICDCKCHQFFILWFTGWYLSLSINHLPSCCILYGKKGVLI